MLKQHYEVLIIVSNGYPSAKGRLPTRYSPVRRFPLNQSDESSIIKFSLDLHVLGTPPAFILSQDQTLNKMVYYSMPQGILYSVTRMTHYASLLCFEFSRTNKFLLVCLFASKSFKFWSYDLNFQDLFCTMKFSRFRCAFQRQLHYSMQTYPLCQHFFQTFFKKFCPLSRTYCEPGIRLKKSRLSEPVSIAILPSRVLLRARLW